MGTGIGWELTRHTTESCAGEQAVVRVGASALGVEHSAGFTQAALALSDLLL